MRIWSFILFVALGSQTLACLAQRKPQDIVEAMFNAFNAHDASAMSTLYSVDSRLTSSDFCSPRYGRKDVRRTYEQLFKTFPDIQDEVKLFVVESDTIAVKFVAHMHIDGKASDLPIATFLKIRGNYIESDESTFDTGGRPCSN